MKGIRTLALCLTLLVATPAITTVPGCSAVGHIEDTPRGQYFQIQEAYIASVTIAIQRKRAGHISQLDWDTKINPAIQTGNQILDDMEVAVDAGDFDKLRAARQLLLEVLQIMEAQQ